MNDEMWPPLRRATRALFACLVVAGSHLGFPRQALAGSRFDGMWNLTFVTQRGACDSTYNFTVDVLNGNITHPNILTFKAVSLNRAPFAPRSESDRDTRRDLADCRECRAKASGVATQVSHGAQVLGQPGGIDHGRRHTASTGSRLRIPRCVMERTDGYACKR